VILLTEDDVVRLLPMDEAIAAMRETFRALATGDAVNQPRRRLHLPTGSVLHSMAGAAGAYFGTKIYSTNVRHGAHFFLLLFDAATAEPLAMIESNHLGQIRTGAASGYATDILASPQACTLGVIGSGFQARAQVDAVLSVREIGEVRVYSRRKEKREAFAADCERSFGVSACATESAEAAVRDADIVVTATFSKDPVIEDAWIRPGAHINAIGSNNPQRRELPAGLIARASLIAVDSIEQSRIESGDLILAWAAEDWNTPRLVELKDAAFAHRVPDDITIFKSNGLGVEDVAAGALIYEKARAQGIGQPLYS
jgi:ornithine cyclodeaminase/alanine dehydrogenase-like protein (mu-crystallin family)